MEEIKVLITCSGLGSRLGELTNFTNKSLVRIGKKPVLTHIIDSYDSTTKFVITVGHYADHVKQYMQIAHPERDIKIVDVDKFEGEGSSLGYSMLQARDHLECPFIFHACDTLTSPHDHKIENNSVWVSNSRSNLSSYRTTLTHGRQLKSIQDKGESETGQIYIGKCLVRDHETFWNFLESLYDENVNDKTLSDCHVINKMLTTGHHFSVIQEPDWSDIGNIDSLNGARNKFKEDSNVLDKFDESIFFVGDKVIKFFHNTDTVQARVQRANYLEGTVPKVEDYTQNFFSYKKVPGEILSRTTSFNEDMMSVLLDWTYEKLWSKKCENNIEEKCEDFYITKSKSRIKKYHDDRRIDEQVIKINGLTVQKSDDLLDLAEDILMGHIHPSRFHGDFILENVLLNNNDEFVLIDWRQDFAKSVQYGDAYYDLAKMNHNIIVNHDLINEGHFSVKIDDDSVNVDILCSKRFVDSRRAIEKFCLTHGFNMKKVDILTSIIWMNMAPLHDKRFGDFLFYFGKYNLARIIKNEQDA